MAEPKSSSGSNGDIPRWVKVQGILVVLLVLVILGMVTGLPGMLLGVGDHGAPPRGN